MWPASPHPVGEEILGRVVRRDEGGTEGCPALGAADALTTDHRGAERSIATEVRRSVAKLDLVERRRRPNDRLGAYLKDDDLVARSFVRRRSVSERRRVAADAFASFVHRRRRHYDDLQSFPNISPGCVSTSEF